MTKTGTLEYTERAYSQDSSDALRGDIVRGLVELITNSDDAYVRAHRSGPIRIRVEHLDDAVHCAAITVADAGTGMTSAEMISNLTRLGARSSAFGSGESVRGLHGRGARDLAIFGSVRFESVANGKYSALRIDGIRWELTDADEPEEEGHLRALGLTLGQAGMTVTVQVKRPNLIPADLAERLSLNAELRHILNEREVTLTETGMRNVPTQRLVYDAPALVRALLDTTVIIPGYEGRTATLKVAELALPDVGPITPETQHGILIRGARAVYQNALFDMGSRPGASYLHGEFVCPLIDELIREFDDVEEAGKVHTSENPFRLLTRSRDGLTPTHPLTRKIKAVFAANLLPLIQEIEARHSGQREPGEALKRRLDQAARELARLLADDLAEIEEEPTGTGEEIAPIKLIPSRVTLRPHERKTLTIHLRPAKLSESWDGEIEIRNDNPRIIEILGAADAVSEHPDNPDLWITRVRLSALETEGTAVITVRAGDDAASATIRVDSLAPPPPDAPETLEFSHERYRLRASRRRTVELAAPLDLVVSQGPEVMVEFDGGAGMVLLTQRCRMQLDENLGWYKGRVSIRGELAGATGVVTATLGTERARAHFSVVEPTDPGGLDLRFEWQDTKQGPLRASLVPEPEGMKLVIFGGHPGIAPILGRWNDETERFEHDDSHEVGLVLSEIIATEIAHYILERDFARPGRLFDSGTYAAQYRRRLERYLVVAQRLLVRSA